MTDEVYMRRCFQIASHGLGRVRPNPMVGCVIVKDEEIVSEGYHQMLGQNHAERNAILHCLHPEKLEGSTLYCNLEPCSHYGLTPPCADLIVEHKIGRVVCSCDDPNPKVDGKGFRILQAAGIEVVRHLLEEEGRFLNRRFFTFQEKHRPYVILKWAESADGFMAPDYAPFWITNPLLRQLSHRWRTEEAAILVGSETFIQDHPQLNARLWKGTDPTPVVLDRSGRIDPSELTPHWLHLATENAVSTLDALYEKNLQSFIVEGGAKVLHSFLQSGQVDEIRILRSPQCFGSGLKAPHINATPHHIETYSDNTVSYYYC